MKTDQQNIFDANSIFDNGFLHGKALYMYCFNAIPSENFINDIDGEKAFGAIKEKFAGSIKSIHAYRHYDQKSKAYDFNETFMIMQNRCILEFDRNYCEIYHDGLHEGFILQCTELMQAFKERQRRKPLEINLVTRNRNGLQ